MRVNEDPGFAAVRKRCAALERGLALAVRALESPITVGARERLLDELRPLLRPGVAAALAPLPPQPRAPLEPPRPKEADGAS